MVLSDYTTMVAPPTDPRTLDTSGYTYWTTTTGYHKSSARNTSLTWIEHANCTSPLLTYDTTTTPTLEPHTLRAKTANLTPIGTGRLVTHIALALPPAWTKEWSPPPTTNLTSRRATLLKSCLLLGKKRRTPETNTTYISKPI